MPSCIESGKVWQTFAILEGPSTAAGAAHTPPSCRGWIVWAVGVLAYVLAVMQRTTFAVAGLDAADRFAITPGALSAFVFVQVAVYLAAQIPGGPRGGPVRLPRDARGQRGAAGRRSAAARRRARPAVGRARPGAGRPRRRLGVLGGARARPAVVPGAPGAAGHPGDDDPLPARAGALRAAVRWVLHGAGWSAAFGAAAAASALVAVLVFAVVRNAPAGVVAPAPAGASMREIRGACAAVWRRPGTRLGFFGHMGTQFSMMVFTLLWGVPWLVTRAGPLRRPRRAAAHPVRRVHDRDRPRLRDVRHAPPAAPLVGGARGDRRGGGGLDGRARAARSGAAWLLVLLIVVLGRGGSRLGRRHRHRPHPQPERQPRRRPEHGQHGRVPGLARRAGRDGRAC